MMEVFDIWNQQKQLLENKSNTKTFKERDIFFVSLGKNVGSEQDGKGDQFLRPVLVYKKFSRTLFLGIPLTTKPKTGRFYASFSFEEKTSIAILSQIRLFDAKRIQYKVGKISQGNFRKIKQKLIRLLQ